MEHSSSLSCREQFQEKGGKKMEMIKIIHPTLEDYYARVCMLAKKYGHESWMKLSPDSLTAEERFEFSFIVSTFEDKLVHREFEEMSRAPDLVGCTFERSTEPGMIPGSVFCMG
jgi:hypothetical protein